MIESKKDFRSEAFLRNLKSHKFVQQECFFFHYSLATFLNPLCFILFLFCAARVNWRSSWLCTPNRISLPASSWVPAPHRPATRAWLTSRHAPCHLSPGAVPAAPLFTIDTTQAKAPLMIVTVTIEPKIQVGFVKIIKIRNIFAVTPCR